MVGFDSRHELLADTSVSAFIVAYKWQFKKETKRLKMAPLTMLSVVFA